MSDDEKINQENAEPENSQQTTEILPVSQQENTSVEQSELSTINHESLTNMEVHHHPDLHHKPKKWKEYFLEFLMIFLAVTMGFFAENIREHFTERTKEKEYMHSLSKDLESDSALINETNSYNTRMFKADSSLLVLLQFPNKDSITLAKIYELYPATTNFDTQINDPKTFEQLKGTGDFRLIKNKPILDSIAKYYQYISVTKTFRDEIQSQLQLTYNLSFKIFDEYSFKNNKVSAPPLTKDSILIKEYTNKLYNLSSSFKQFNIFLEGIKTKSVSLNMLIKKEYHLENE